MARLEFFYDLSSPWTRLAFYNIQPIIKETNAEPVWRPFLVGGVFNAVNDSVYAARSNPDNPKLRNTNHWLKDWARLAGLPMNFPSIHHPLKSVLPMRVCCALEKNQDDLLLFSQAAFTAYFTEQRNLDDPSELIKVARDCGFDGEELVSKANTQPIKDLLRANTDEAITRGAFGSPTIFVDEKRLYFGNDQLPLVRQALTPDKS